MRARKASLTPRQRAAARAIAAGIQSGRLGTMAAVMREVRRATGGGR